MQALHVKGTIETKRIPYRFRDVKEGVLASRAPQNAGLFDDPQRRRRRGRSPQAGKAETTADLRCRCLPGGLSPGDAPQEVAPLGRQGRSRFLQRGPLPRSLFLNTGPSFRLNPDRLRPACLDVHLGGGGLFWDRRRKGRRGAGAKRLSSSSILVVSLGHGVGAVLLRGQTKQPPLPQQRTRTNQR